MSSSTASSTAALSTSQIAKILTGALADLAPAPAATPVSKRCCATGCRTKLGLTAITCHCGKKFCSLHRYPEEHACEHDYRADGKKELLKTMSSAIVGAKLEKV